MLAQPAKQFKDVLFKKGQNLIYDVLITEEGCLLRMDKTERGEEDEICKKHACIGELLRPDACRSRRSFSCTDPFSLSEGLVGLDQLRHLQSLRSCSGGFHRAPQWRAKKIKKEEEERGRRILQSGVQSPFVLRECLCMWVCLSLSLSRGIYLCDEVSRRILTHACCFSMSRQINIKYVCAVEAAICSA